MNLFVTLCDSSVPDSLRCSLKVECEEQEPSIVMLLLLALGWEAAAALWHATAF